MIFDMPLLLFLAPVIGLLAGAAAWLVRRRRIHRARRWSPSLAAEARRRGGWAPLVLGLVALLAAVGLAGPRAGRAQIETESRALSVVFAVDISRSMLAEDVAPSRLGRARRELGRLVHDLDGDRMGLIAFAGRSYILAPLTVDGGAIRMYLDALDPEIASEGGSSLALALSQGRELLSSATDAADRVLVVFSDGESHDTLPAVIAAAEALRDAEIQLIFAAEGEASPAQIPVRDASGALVEYQRDANGQIIRTARADDIVRAVVDAAEGTLVPNEMADQAGGIRSLLATMKRRPSTASRAADLVPRAWIPVLLAVLLLIGYTLLRSGPALIGIVLVTSAVPSVLAAQRRSAGERAMAADDPLAAASAYLDAARSGSGTDTAFYNAGTAALEAGRLDVARGALAKAATSLDPELRYRALYNLGLAELRAAETDSAREQRLADAVEHLREALRLQPGSARAKWNLELAERRRPPPPPSGGGGGGPPPPSGGGGGAAPPQPRPQEPAGGLTREQAEQILASMERREQETRDEQRRRMAGETRAGVKDW